MTKTKTPGNLENLSLEPQHLMPDPAEISNAALSNSIHSSDKVFALNAAASELQIITARESSGVPDSIKSTSTPNNFPDLMLYRNDPKNGQRIAKELGPDKTGPNFEGFLLRYKRIPEPADKSFDWQNPKDLDPLRNNRTVIRRLSRNLSEFANLMKLILFVTIVSTLVILANAKSVSRAENRKIILVSDRENNPELIRQLDLLNREMTGLRERDVVIEKKIDPASDFSFTLILVGKDGVNKFCSHALQSGAALFNIIDELPNRKRELKEKQKI